MTGARTRPRTRTARTVVGVLALLLALSGCTAPFSGSTITVTAYLADSAGVFVGNDVGVLGVPVGTITAIDPQGNRVAVTMEVDADQPVPAGAAAVVVPRSVATDRYIELTPVYRDGPRMESGAEIPLDRTRTPVEFDEVLSTLGDLADGLGGKGTGGKGGTRKAVRRLLDSSSKALDGRGELINRTITSLGEGATGITGQRGKAFAALGSLDRLTGKLARNDRTVRKFVDQVAGATSILATERRNFRTSLRKVTRMIRVVARFARENRRSLRGTVENTNEVMRTVLDEKDSVRELLRVMPLAVQNLERMLTPDDRLAVRLDITSLLPVVGPLLEELCRLAPADLCSGIGLDPNGLLGVIGDLLNPGGDR
jgi:phospholipid/cholesterol/gamma-HCH transport system substrate-binding protein